jgi:5-methylcytosine-specific restriction endonuclease McrA
MSNADWSYKDPDKKADKFLAKAEKKLAKKNRRKKRKEIKKARGGFYMSDDWRKLRYRVIRKYKATCMACGRNYKEHAVVIHVDHIKPRSKYPKLELDFNNMQVLCECCNLGKSNTDETDWRPDNVKNDLLNNKIDIEITLDDELMDSLPVNF